MCVVWEGARGASAPARPPHNAQARDLGVRPCPARAAAVRSCYFFLKKKLQSGYGCSIYTYIDLAIGLRTSAMYALRMGF